MARNGLSQLSVAEVGVSPESDPGSLLREFDGMQYFGVFLVPEEGAHGQAAAERHRQYQLAAERAAAFSSRAVLRFTSSLAAAAALPLHSLDVALVDVGRSRELVAQDLQWWESRVRPGGVLGGHGFGPGSAGGVRAVCDHRFGNDMHLGAGGTFWYLV